MAVNIDYFLKQKFKEYELAGALRTVDIYYNIENQYLRHLFAIPHQEFNRLQILETFLNRNKISTYEIKLSFLEII